jgi:predicted NAD-dependent protein-ADP-ribosyltransferase YbiA (DUF1768 family)
MSAFFTPTLIKNNLSGSLPFGKPSSSIYLSTSTITHQEHLTMPVFNGIDCHNIHSLTDEEKSSEFRNLVRTINLLQDEDYDCTTLNVWSYRKGTDIRDGIQIKFGNMCTGFTFSINGVRFHNSETAYISGMYASKTPDCIRIQNELTKMTNGYLAKRIYRNRNENTKHIRTDWYEYNVQWMLFVVWQKCQSNTDFKSLMTKIPVDAHVVENTTGLHGSTSSYWGAKNKELMDVRKEVYESIARNRVFRFRYEREEAQILATNGINNVGHFVGKNLMGKIIKICSLSLLYGQEPLIDYSFLSEKGLFLLGRPVEFKG